MNACYIPPMRAASFPVFFTLGFILLMAGPLTSCDDPLETELKESQTLPEAVVLPSRLLRPGLAPKNLTFHFFEDDNFWDGLDRTQILPSQNAGKDPRDQIQGSEARRDTPLKERLLTEILTREIRPTLATLSQLELGSGLSPMEVFQKVALKITRVLQKNLKKLERELALPDGRGPRHIVFWILPWEQNPFPERSADHLRYETQQRFSDGRWGYDSRRQTPLRGFVEKFRLPHVTWGPMGGTGARISEYARQSIAAETLAGEEYGDQTFAVNPPVYPVAFLLHLKVNPNAQDPKDGSSLTLQALMGLQPSLQPLPPEETSGVTVNAVGTAFPGGITTDPDAFRYPLMLAQFGQPLALAIPESIRFHVDFGVWEQYNPHTRRMVITHDHAWMRTPFLQGVMDYKGVLNARLRIHITELDLVSQVNKKQVNVENLMTGIEIFKPKIGGLKIPLGVIGITHDRVTAKSNDGLQTALNEKIQAMVEDLKTKANRSPLGRIFFSGGESNP